MRYVKNEPFISFSGEDFMLRQDSEEPHPALFSEIITIVLDNYVPQSGNPQAGEPPMKLKEVQLGYLNSLDILLRKKPAIIKLEDPEYDVLKSVCQWIIPIMTGGIMRNMPGIMEIVNDATKENPEEVSEPEELDPDTDISLNGSEMSQPNPISSQVPEPS